MGSGRLGEFPPPVPVSRLDEPGRLRESWGRAFAGRSRRHIPPTRNPEEGCGDEEHKRDESDHQPQHPGRGRFREDLYYRLKVVFLRMPSLRDIPEDIPILADRYLADICREQGRPRMDFEPGLLERLQAMPWPGNSRQLQNEIRRLVACSRGPVLREEDWSVGQAIPRPSRGPAPASIPDPPSEPRLGAAVEALERRMISEALQRCGHNQMKAAKSLGISRQGLLNKLKRLGLPRRWQPVEPVDLGEIGTLPA